MILELLAAVLTGLALGTLTGLIPGIHVNLLSALIVSSLGLFSNTPLIVISVAIVSMATTHTFLDPIPSIYLGAPEGDMALGVLPGHRMLLEGKGFEAVRLTVIGSFCCMIFTIALMPLVIPILPFVSKILTPFIGYILLAIVLFMIFKDKKKSVHSLLIFLISGTLGIIVNKLNVEQSLFPLLSGLFGVSGLVMSLASNTKIPKQIISEDINPNFKTSMKAFAGAVLSGSITGLMPGIGASQAAVLAIQFLGKLGHHAFLMMLGGISTVNFIFSIATFASINKARNGAIVAVQSLIENIEFYQTLTLISAMLFSGSIATLIAPKLCVFFSNNITKISYSKLCSFIIIFITSMVIILSGLKGFLVLIVATIVGTLPPLYNVTRTHLMGCLLLPTILFFLNF
jgi:putative membrane protein